MFKKAGETVFDLNGSIVARFSNDIDGSMTCGLFLNGLAASSVVTVYDEDDKQYVVGEVKTPEHLSPNETELIYRIGDNRSVSKASLTLGEQRVVNRLMIGGYINSENYANGMHYMLSDMGFDVFETLK